MDDSNISELLEKCDMYTTNVNDANKYLSLLSKFCNDKNIIKTVMSVMLRYQLELKVQLNGVVCFENFFKQNKIKDVDLDTLKEIVGILVVIVESHSDDDYMMKSSLRILSSIKILHDVDFDRSRCLKAVMNYFAMPRDYDSEVDACALLICCYLSYGVVLFGSTFNVPPQYQTKLLSMIRPHAKTKPINPAALMAVQALIVVTTENSSTCETLIKDGDAEMLIEMLDDFHGESNVVSRILAILYNVLEEVRLFRQQLTQRPLFISKISQFVDSEHMTVAYEAAGIMAYLLIEMPTSPTRVELLDQLHRAIMSWQVPETEVLAEYRTFKPLYSLLQCTDAHSVQLYAAWCIHHVTIRKPIVYFWVLERENGLELLNKLKEDETTHSDVQNLCRKIQEFCLNYFESLKNKYV